MTTTEKQSGQLDNASSGVPRPSVSGHTDRPFFQCGQCNRSYTRVDHLARHVRSHTHEKPFVCHVCSKGFARPDLVKRHAASHDSNRSKRLKTTATHCSRVAQACKACAAAKLKCEEEKPCRRCLRKNLVCSSASTDNANKVHSAPAPAQTDAHDEGLRLENLVSPVNPEQGTGGTPMAAPNDNTLDFNTPNIQGPAQLPTPDTSIQAYNETVFEQESNLFPDIFRDFTMPPTFELSSAFGNPLFYPSRAETPCDDDFGGFSTSLGLSDLDMGFLDAMNNKNPHFMEAFPESGQPIRHNERADVQQEFGRGVALGAEAFRKSSLWAWTPARQDHGYAEQENISLPVCDANSPEAHLSFDRQILSERLSSTSRDQILASVLEICRPGNIPRVVSSFPSAEVMDNLIQHFFDQSASQIDSWIHLPTFNVNSKKPEFLTAIVAMGAVLTPLASVRRMGFALQEIVRLALAQRFEEANINTRELQLLQAYALQIAIGMWSGNRRKIEIAESFSQPLLTMLRRAGRFRRQNGESYVPAPEDAGEILEHKWRNWVHNESFKRLVFHLFLHDAQCSMALSVNPLISYAELTLPLPESSELWHAPTAAHWKYIYLSRMSNTSGASDSPIPSVVETIHNWSLLSQHIYHVDPQLSGLIVLHAVWRLIWEHRQLNSGLKVQPNSWSALVLNSRHQELCQLLRHLGMGFSEWGIEPAPEVKLILETLCVHLHMSFEELQLFTGKEDKEDSKKVYLAAGQWIESQSSRQAVWHAGQAVRAAKSFHKNHLRDFYAIALYHASLTLWSYGIISKAKETEWASGTAPPRGTTSGEGQNTPSAVSFWLDGEDTPDVQRFVTFHRGSPGFQKSETEKILLSDTGAVTDFVRDVLRSNFKDEVAPPLVENLWQLLRDLAGAARAVGS